VIPALSLGVILAFAATSASADVAIKIETYRLKVTTKTFERYFAAGKPYYFRGYRLEAIQLFERCLEVRPNHAGMNRFVRLLRDYDNPAWNKKKWRSPKATVDAAYRTKLRTLDLRTMQDCVRIGSYAAKQRGDDAWPPARKHFVRALEIHGGPYVLDSKHRLDLGKGAIIPPEPTKRLIEAELVTINGALVVRDSMLRALADLSVVQEARGEHALVRTTSARERAEELAEVVDGAWDEFVAHTGQSPDRPLGLFVFDGPEAYRAWCDASGLAEHRMAAGFARIGEGFAVTFEQPGVDAIAVHEAAHLFFGFAYGTSMTSWYDEGFSESFGDETSVSRSNLPAVAADPIPLKEILAGRAVTFINRMDGSGPKFYATAWALYSFLRTTEDERFRAPFDEWEGFCLGARYGERATDAATLFDRLFAGRLEELEEALLAWIRTRLDE